MGSNLENRRDVGRAGRLLVALAIAVQIAVAAAGLATIGSESHEATWVSPLEPAVAWAASGAATFVDVASDREVAVGDVVRTNETGRAQVDYADGSFTRLDAQTTLRVRALIGVDRSPRTRVRLDVGRTWNRVKKVTASESGYEVETPQGTATVRGTIFVVACTPAPATCTFTVIEGRVEVVPRQGEPVTLTDGQQVTIDANGVAGPVQTLAAAQLEADGWVAENRARDANGGRLPPTTTTSTTAPPPTTVPPPAARILVGGSPMRLVDPATGGVTALETSGESPTWSPDRQRFAFTREAGLFVANADGTGERRVGDAPQGDPAWSPDGSTIAVTNADGSAIDGLGPDSGDRRVLVTAPTAAEAGAQPDSRVFMSAPTWSPDGKRLGYSIDIGGGASFWYTELATGQRGKYDASAYGPAWSPDGNRIASATRGVACSGAIVIYDISRNHESKITTARCAIHNSPSWSPEGDRVAYTREADPEPDHAAGSDGRSGGLYVSGADGQNLRQLLEDPALGDIDW